MKIKEISNEYSNILLALYHSKQKELSAKNHQHDFIVASIAEIQSKCSDHKSRISILSEEIQEKNKQIEEISNQNQEINQEAEIILKEIEKMNKKNHEVKQERAKTEKLLEDIKFNIKDTNAEIENVMNEIRLIDCETEKKRIICKRRKDELLKEQEKIKNLQNIKGNKRVLAKSSIFDNKKSRFSFINNTEDTESNQEKYVKQDSLNFDDAFDKDKEIEIDKLKAHMEHKENEIKEIQYKYNE